MTVADSGRRSGHRHRRAHHIRRGHRGVPRKRRRLVRRECPLRRGLRTHRSGSGRRQRRHDPRYRFSDNNEGSRWLRGIGDGTFHIFPQNLESSFTPNVVPGAAIALGDLNGDSWLDAAVATRLSVGHVSVMVNTSALALAAPPVASAGSNGVTVTWTPPDDDSTVIGYTVVVQGAQVYDVPLPVVTYSPTTTSAVVTNLINGNTYTFQVLARNAVGDGPRSGASNPVVSATGLGAPTIGTATQDGFGGIAVSWTAPTEDGGSPVTGYVVTGYIGYFPVLTPIFNSTATTQSITTGLQSGAKVPVPGTRHQRIRHQRGFDRHEPHHRRTDGAASTDGRHRSGRQQPSDGVMDCTTLRRDRDHRLHGHRLHRLLPEPNTQLLLERHHASLHRVDERDVVPLPDPGEQRHRHRWVLEGQQPRHTDTLSHTNIIAVI